MYITNKPPEIKICPINNSSTNALQIIWNDFITTLNKRMQKLFIIQVNTEVSIRPVRLTHRVPMYNNFDR